MTRIPSSPMTWLLGLMASALAAFLLVYYVDLLQEDVARGSQSKYAQRSSAQQASSDKPRTATPDESN